MFFIDYQSIKYQSINNTINTKTMIMRTMITDTFFKALPTDLQWEILTDFVGTHVVRNGKLRRKLVIPVQYPQLKGWLFTNNWAFPWRYGKYGTMYIHPEIPCFLSECVNVVSYVVLSDGGRVMYCEGAITKKMSYIFRTATKIVEGREIWDHERVMLDDSVILDPFVKHTYPSYPFTNKKKEHTSKLLSMVNMRI